MKITILKEKKRTKVSKAGQKRVSDKIGDILSDEPDVEPDQAAAIAYSMERKKELQEILDEIEYDIGKLTPKSKLNHKIWDKNRLINRKVKSNLLKVANDFIKRLGIKDRVKDITITGSLASYNWHKKSDIDLHILVSYEEFDENVDFVKDLMNLQRSNWNRVHDIMIRGHEIEIYIQDITEEHYANGVYSIKRDEWVIKPSPMATDLDTDGAIKKAEAFEKDIDLLSDFVNTKRYKDAVSFADKLKEKIKNLRSSGLERDGVYSIENLAFKLLRNSEQIDKIHSLATQAYDNMMSIDTYSREIDINVIDESFSFQDRVKVGHKEKKTQFIGLGDGKNTPGTEEPDSNRSENSPVGFGGALEEVEIPNNESYSTIKVKISPKSCY